MSKFIIEVRTKGFGKAETELKRVSSQSRSFARQANKSADAGATFRREVSQLRNNMLLYTFAIGGAIAGMGNFIKAASDAREQANQFKVVFGDFAGEADAFASGIQNSFGIAKSEMVALLAGLQDTFVPLGFSRKQASELSMSIAQLSLDVGSFKNLATGDVANRFTSALIGNHEAVRSLGISLTEARIKQEALNIGIIKANEEMTQEAKILGRLSLMFKGTGDAQGDLVNTQEEFANRLRGTTGQLKTLREEIGNALLPLGHFALDIVDFMSNSRRMVQVLIGVTAAFTAYAASAIKAAIATNTLSTAMRRNLVFGAMTLGVIAIDAFLEKIGFFGEEAEKTAPKVKDLGELVQELSNQNLDLSDGVNEATDSIKKQKEAAEQLAQSIQKSENALLIRLALMHEETELGKARVRTFVNEKRDLTDLEIARLKEIDNINAKKDAQKRQIEVEQQLNNIRRESAIIQLQLDNATNLEVQQMQILQNTAMDLADAIPEIGYKDVISEIKDFTTAEELANLEISHSDALTEQLAQSIRDLGADQLELAVKIDLKRQKQIADNQAVKDAAKAAAEHARNMSMLAGGIVAVAGALKQAGDESMTFEQQMSLAMQTIGGILMMTPGMQVPGALLQAGSMFVGHTGGLIKDNGIQRFANGGMVQGQDNVPILAQSGEFIMQRSAVQNIGVQNLAAMNAGESTGGVTINIEGNMIGNDEFIRETLIPGITKVSRQQLA